MDLLGNMVITIPHKASIFMNTSTIKNECIVCISVFASRDSL